MPGGRGGRARSPSIRGQKVRELADGGVILDIERAWDEEIIPQLLGLGDMVEVLEPEDVRGRIVDEARRIVDRYAGRLGTVTAQRGSRRA